MKFDTTVSTVKDDYNIRLESVLDFLAKPVYLTTAVWSSSNLRNATIFSADVGTVLYSNGYWMNKIQGFSLIRGTACIRYQLNSNPFQCGRLLAHFLPNAMSRTDPGFEAMHNACLTTKTQQPNIEISTADAVGIMKVPFIAPANWRNLNPNIAGTTSADWGKFYLSVEVLSLIHI